MRPMPPRSRFAPLSLAAASLFAGCGGGTTWYPSGGFVANFPDEGPGTPSLPPILPPPPRPSAQPIWQADAFPLGRIALFGSFPSDLVRYGDTLFTTDADAIEAEGARVTPVDVSAPTPVPSSLYAVTTIHASDLVDSNGQPGDANNPVGFGFFLNDLCIADDRTGFVLANAGGSDTVPTCCNVVVFDPRTGAIRQVVDLANPFSPGGPLIDSAGAPVPGNAFTQAGAEGVEYVPQPSGGGLLFVAMSNFVFGPPSYGTVKYPGTVQVFDVDPAASVPVTPRSQGPFVTQTLVTSGYNPAAVSRWTGQTGVERLLVTVAGTSVADVTGRLVPASDAFVEVHDGATLAFLGVFRLGPAALASTRPALGHDGDGHRVGFFASSVNGEAYLLRLDGLDSDPVDADRVAVLRGPANGIPVEPASAGLPGGNVAGIALSDSGRTLVVAGFGDLFAFPAPKPGRLLALSLPKDLVASSSFGNTFVPGTASLVTSAGRTLGSLVLLPGGGPFPDVFVAVGGLIDLSTFLGAGQASLGSLTTFGAVE